MVGGSSEFSRRLTGVMQVLRSAETWRVSSRYLLLVVSALVTFSVLAAAIPTFFGMDSFIIDGGSMRPAVPAGALVVSRRVDPALVQAGDIITFRHSTSPDTPVTHRVVKVLREQSGTVNLLTKGDANATADPEAVATDLPVSRMVYSLPYAGYVLEFSRTSTGKVALIAVPALLLLLSIGRKSAPTTLAQSPNEAIEADTDVTALEKVAATMVNANPASTLASDSALGRLAQRPQAPAATGRPGLMRRLVAAFNDAPTVEAPVALAQEQVAPAMAAVAPLRPVAAARPAVMHMPAAQPVVQTSLAQTMAQPVAQPMTRPMQAVTVVAAPIEELQTEEGAPQLLHLARLRLRSVARLADITQSFDRVEHEAAPLLDLVTELDVVRQRFAQNLDEAMRPLTEFADRWDENLMTLAERLEGDLPQQIDVEAERRRIAEIRAQIPRRHTLLLDQFEIEKQAIDAALTVFDEQVARLETQLTAARRTAEAIGDSMRTADFGRTVAFLRRRTEQLALLAEGGAATPADIAAALPAASTLASDEAEMLANSPYLRSVLTILDDEADAGPPRMAHGAA